MNTKRVVLAGGSGFLGAELIPALTARGEEVIVLTRKPAADANGARQVYWDGRELGPWVALLEGAHAVINLAGRSVNCRYTEKNRREINASRVDSVKVIGEAIRRCSRPPKVWIQSGSLALYGDTGERWCDEETPPGSGFPVETCKLWEAAFHGEATPQTRKVLLRIGIVLGRRRGGLKLLESLTRWGLGGRVGAGNQYVSWIHRIDMNRIFEHALDQTAFEGVFNVCAPEPVPNAELMRQLRRVVGRPWSPPAPVWAVHLGCWLMRTEPCLALTGRRCTPAKLVQHGFNFRWPKLAEALNELYAADTG